MMSPAGGPESALRRVDPQHIFAVHALTVARRTSGLRKLVDNPALRLVSQPNLKSVPGHRLVYLFNLN